MDYFSVDTKVIWDEFSIYVRILDENLKDIEDNQRIHKARIRRLIPEYQEGIIYIVQNIIKDISTNKIRKIIKEKENN